MPDILPHVWQPHARNPRFAELQGSRDSVVHLVKDPARGYLWQFRKVVSYAATIEAAKEYVEAGAEFFDVMHRNPYA